MSLRERKKAGLRRELVEVSQRLFDRQGFEPTTLDQICAEVEVTPKTLLRYFPSKADLALAPLFDAFERFTTDLTAAENVPVLTIWRRHVQRYADNALIPKIRRFHEFLFRTPSLQPASYAISLSYQKLLSDALAHEAGVDPDSDLFSKLLAALLLGGNARVFMDWLEAGGKTDLPAALLEVVDVSVRRFRR